MQRKARITQDNARSHTIELIESVLKKFPLFCVQNRDNIPITEKSRTVMVWIAKDMEYSLQVYRKTPNERVVR